MRLTLRKIKKYISRGQLEKAINFSLESLVEDAPQQEGILAVQKELKTVQRNFKRKNISDREHQLQLSGLIEHFVGIVKQLEKKPEYLKKTSLFARTWFWIFLLLAILFLPGLLRTDPPPPPRKVTLSYNSSTSQFTLDAVDNDQLNLELNQVNELHQKRNQLLNFIPINLSQPIIHLQAEDRPLIDSLKKVREHLQAEVKSMEVFAIRELCEEVIFFEKNEAEVADSNQVVLNKIHQMLSLNPELSFQIIGYADSTGVKEHNYELSCRRAKAVEDKFREISPSNSYNIELKCGGELESKTALRVKSQRMVQFKIY